MKKLLLSSLFLGCALSWTGEANKENIENYDTGKNKITQIIKNSNTSTTNRYRNNEHFAEAENLENDLNLGEVADFMGCKTLIGRTFMQETLAHPLNTQAKTNLLTARQKAIKTLVDNPELKATVEQLLEQAKEAEQEVIKLMSDYFKGRTCPELAQLEALKTSNPWIYSVNNYLLSTPVPKTIGLLLSTAGFIGGGALTAFCGINAYQAVQLGANAATPIAAGIYYALVTGVSGYANYKDYTAAMEKREKMHGLYTLIKVAEQIDALYVQHDIKAQFSIQDIQDTDGRTLINKLKNPRYKHKKSYFFLTPLVHTLLYRLYEEDHHLSNIFTAIAELDAYNALASKIIASPYSDNKFCFVNFLDNPKPEVQAKGFWNVLVPGAVVNDISESKHVLLTGPNKGGKSTSIKAILQNIVMGQSFGIAAAEQFDFTMFDVVHSYLNVSDDLINGLSLFASELKRAQDILAMIKSLQSGDRKFFFALDELFTGTAAEDGEVCAYEFVKKIATFDNIMFIYATHFGKLKVLGEENIGCINYKVDAPVKNEFGILTYPFTISQGASNVNVAIDLARESGLFS